MDDPMQTDLKPPVKLKRPSIALKKLSNRNAMPPLMKIKQENGHVPNGDMPHLKEEPQSNGHVHLENPLMGVPIKKEMSEEEEMPYFLGEEYNEEVEALVRKTKKEKEMADNSKPNSVEKDEDSEREEKSNKRKKKQEKKVHKLVRDLRNFSNPSDHIGP